MKVEDFDFLSTLIKQRSGLVLTQEKSYLLESRLMPLSRKRGLRGLEELVTEMRTKNEESLIQEVTEAMTTNESFFFRDIKPFEIFSGKVLPYLLQNRVDKKSFRVWCAAASSGQEPYSLAISLVEQANNLAGWRTEIVGTDISKEILEKAKSGLYSQFEVQRGLPIELLLKHFDKKDDMWQASSALRSMVQYKELNLLGDLQGLGKFDVVFCRNVLIYFDKETKTKVLEQISELMPDDGVLFLGGAETVIGITEHFKPIPGCQGAYCRAESNITLS